jgi:hypothetical protein
MEATRYSETSVEFKRTTRRYIPETILLHKHSRENVISLQIFFVPYADNFVLSKTSGIAVMVSVNHYLFEDPK